MQFSVVSYLDESSSKAVRELQRDLSRITGSVASLSSWEPHITLGDGVELNNAELEAFRSELKDTVSHSKPFKLELTGFSALANRPIGIHEESTPYAIFIDVAVNENLTKLVSAIADRISPMKKWYLMPRPYLPHVTLAFRDLTKKGYELGLEFMRQKDIATTATINHVALVEKLPTSDEERIRVSF